MAQITDAEIEAFNCGCDSGCRWSDFYCEACRLPYISPDDRACQCDWEILPPEATRGHVHDKK